MRGAIYVFVDSMHVHVTLPKSITPVPVFPNTQYVSMGQNHIKMMQTMGVKGAEGSSAVIQ